MKKLIFIHVAIPLIFGGLIYILVALMWLIPDKRIEGIFDEENL